MTLQTILSAERVFVDLRASGKKQALQLIASLAERTLQLDSEQVLGVLKEREKLSSTGVGGGVAIPHARLPGLQAIKGLFLRFDTPLKYQAIDDEPVDLVFALFGPENAGAEHLKALAQISRCMRFSEMRERLRLAPDAAACLVILKNGAARKLAS
jgi:PTS system nitrogen regulatory IIA component